MTTTAFPAYRSHYYFSFVCGAQGYRSWDAEDSTAENEEEIFDFERHPDDNDMEEQEDEGIEPGDQNTASRKKRKCEDWCNSGDGTAQKDIHNVLAAVRDDRLTEVTGLQALRGIPGLFQLPDDFEAPIP
eukprot:CAMPEP_0178463288 /NCGR_PEP_ID=MMETSP0689_2-20121128/50258_1 /TAXON_ID=160604 /ORGANISM="Amphidinium massartii, Strain CS-259" /LENGTH=129 /DNA_ID=CAMNT_0020090171 /DNA_START=84 /DNA_END=469 /DNA_ORIENTATION=+